MSLIAIVLTVFGNSPVARAPHPLEGQIDAIEYGPRFSWIGAQTIVLESLLCTPLQRSSELFECPSRSRELSKPAVEVLVQDIRRLSPRLGDAVQDAREARAPEPGSPHIATPACQLPGRRTRDRTREHEEPARLGSVSDSSHSDSSSKSSLRTLGRFRISVATSNCLLPATPTTKNQY